MKPWMRIWILDPDPESGSGSGIPFPNWDPDPGSESIIVIRNRKNDESVSCFSLNQCESETLFINVTHLTNKCAASKLFFDFLVNISSMTMERF